MAVDVDLRMRLRGVGAVLVTPFRPDGGIDEEVLRGLARRCDGAGIHVLIVLGNTAEVYQLTAAERRCAAQAVAEVRDQSALVLSLAGPLAEMLDVAEYAADLGYDGVMLHEPLDPLGTGGEIHKLWVQVVEKAPLPAIPYVRTDRVWDAALLDLVEHPRVAGIKLARPDTTSTVSLLSRTTPQATWICGGAESNVPLFAAFGTHGFSSGIANVRPDLALGVWTASSAGDWPALHAALQPLLPLEMLRISDHSRYSVAALKEALALDGIDAGGVRPPCAPLDSKAAARVREIVAAWPTPDPAAAVAY